LNEKYVNIAINISLNRLFTYKVPSMFDEDIEIGKRVLIPFGKKIITGIVYEILESTSLNNTKNIKGIIDDERIIGEELVRFCKWISDYYIAPIGEVLFSTIPKHLNLESGLFYSLCENYKKRIDTLENDKEFIFDILDLFNNNQKLKLTKRQIEKKLNAKDIAGYLEFLSEQEILKKETNFNKQPSEKLIRIVYPNFKENDIENIFEINKIKSEKQKILLRELSNKGKSVLSELLKSSGLSSSSVNTLIKKNLIKVEEIKSEREYTELFEEEPKNIILNNEQKYALEQFDDALKKNLFQTFLLYGITGSGKTEVYINTIKVVLEMGKTAIVLVPEISLTPQLIHRMKRNFGNKVGVIHSRLTEGERFDTFQKMRRNEYSIIIGARSALFSPLKNTGLIIIDEEHDNSYKQENSPRYNARDAAIMRGKINNAVVILGSATPSVESYYNATNGKYKLITLTKRATDINLPIIKIVDLKKKFIADSQKSDFFEFIDNVKIKFLSKDLILEIGERLEKKESIILLQNRRGYHSYLECVKCGNVEMCPRCSISLTYHKAIGILKCHYCGFSKNLVEYCSNCGSNFLIQKGAGTEKVEEELVKIFPKAIIKRLDSDTLTSRKLYQTILKDFYDKKIDILVGTQIISKGLDFPEVTLVGVVNADIGLLHPDFRATEKTFQILTQVSGRSGRSEKKGEVLIQTNHSEYYVFDNVMNHDFKSFYEKELNSRRVLNYPPFSRIAIVEIKSKEKLLAESKIKELYNFINIRNKNKFLEILPPGQPLFAKLKDLHRYHLLIKSKKDTDPAGANLIKTLNDVKAYSEKNFSSKIRVKIDMDAINLL
jgi:primosomal protein N' (replication factor Y) (superfamily II helicase)